MLAFIAEKGLAILEALDTPVDNLYKNQFTNLSKKDLDKLVKLLRKVASHN
jgi:DNA-binding MarR family transcriptional regulator